MAYEKVRAKFPVDHDTTDMGLKAVWEHHKRYINWDLPPLVGMSQNGIFAAIFRGTDFDGKPFRVVL